MFDLAKLPRDKLRDKIAKLKIMKTVELRKLNKPQLIDTLINNHLCSMFPYDDSLFGKYHERNKNIHFSKTLKDNTKVIVVKYVIDNSIATV